MKNHVSTLGFFLQTRNKKTKLVNLIEIINVSFLSLDRLFVLFSHFGFRTRLCQCQPGLECFLFCRSVDQTKKKKNQYSRHVFVKDDHCKINFDCSI